MPTNGIEWRLLKGLTFTPAYHILRLLTNGLRGTAQTRNKTQRLAFPPAMRLRRTSYRHCVVYPRP